MSEKTKRSVVYRRRAIGSQRWVTVVKSCKADSLQGAVRGAIDTAVGSAVDIPFDRIGNPAERYVVDAVNSFPIVTIANQSGPMWYEAVAVVRFPISQPKKK